MNPASPMSPESPDPSRKDALAGLRTATRTHHFTESVIREMTRLCADHKGVNLAQGFPDDACPRPLKDNVLSIAIEAGEKH